MSSVVMTNQHIDSKEEDDYDFGEEENESDS